MAAIDFMKMKTKIKSDFQIKIFRHKKKWYWDVYSDRAQMGIFGPDVEFDNVDDLMKDIAKAIKRHDLDEQKMLFLGL